MKTDPLDSPQKPPPAPAPAPEPIPAEEELVQYDDRVIGSAFRWSVIALLALGLGAGGLVYWLNRKPARKPVQVTQLTAPVVKSVPLAEIPEATFTDITTSAGIGFVHHNGAYGEKLLPETMGGGVAFFDYDNDGLPDVLFVNSTDWPWHPSPDKAKPTMALYHNEGSGRFRDVTAGSGLDVSFYGMGVAVGDYDNDGFEDVFISAVRR